MLWAINAAEALELAEIEPPVLILLGLDAGADDYLTKPFRLHHIPGEHRRPAH